MKRAFLMVLLVLFMGMFLLHPAIASINDSSIVNDPVLKFGNVEPRRPLHDYFYIKIKIPELCLNLLFHEKLSRGK